MPQTAGRRKTARTSSQGRKPAKPRSRAKAGASSRSGSATARKPASRKKKAPARPKQAKKAAKAKAKKAPSRGRAAATRKQAARSTTSRSRRKPPVRKTNTRKASGTTRKAAKETTRRDAGARATTSASARTARSAASSAAGQNGSGGLRIKDALLARRAETLDLLERSTDYGKQRLREDAEDLVDQATDSQAREVVYALSSAEGDMIKRIDGALERIDSGQYGTCINCGDPIQKRRLEAVPWATLCVACQELQEQGILQMD
jgi:DnaK suppressor protein